MLLLLFAGAETPPPDDEDEFHPVGGKGVRGPARLRTGRSASSQAEGAAFMLEMQVQQAAERDLRDLQELTAALFAFKGIF